MDALTILEVIVERVNVGIIVVNEACELVLWNHFLESHSQRKATDLIGKNLFDAFPELPRPWLERKIKNVFILKNFSFTSWEQRPYLFKFRHNRPITGGVDHMRQNCTFLPIKNPAGEVTHVCITLFDVTDTSIYQGRLKDAMHSLAEASNRDGLTGIYNRRFLEEILSREYSRVTRYNGVLSFILIDLDFFKKVNDNYGHLAGDEVLKIAATRIQNGLRTSDILARYGGEEFAVILPETPLEGAAVLADRLRIAIGSTPIQFNNTDVNIGASIGVAQLTEKTQSYEEVIGQADLALYYSKENGRNQVTLCIVDGKNEMKLEPYQAQEFTQLPPLTTEKNLLTHQSNTPPRTSKPVTEQKSIGMTTDNLIQTIDQDKTTSQINSNLATNISPGETTLTNAQSIANANDLNEPTPNHLLPKLNAEIISNPDIAIAVDQRQRTSLTGIDDIQSAVTTTTANESTQTLELEPVSETQIVLNTMLETNLASSQQTELELAPATAANECTDTSVIADAIPFAVDDTQPDTEFTTESQLNAEETTTQEEETIISEQIMPNSTVSLPLTDPKNIIDSSSDPTLIEQAVDANDIEEDYEIRIKIGHS